MRMTDAFGFGLLRFFGVVSDLILGVALILALVDLPIGATMARIAAER